MTRKRVLFSVAVVVLLAFASYFALGARLLDRPLTNVETVDTAVKECTYTNAKACTGVKAEVKAASACSFDGATKTAKVGNVTKAAKVSTNGVDATNGKACCASKK